METPIRFSFGAKHQASPLGLYGLIPLATAIKALCPATYAELVIKFDWIYINQKTDLTL
ncbi:hypothetical protein FEV09_08140 [Pseudanabaena catenata USMAC16]|uniref:Uncharacterized protein n=1 Tax=Pseudanabaena catenata USMAC16 TaxID=1855837 RepID=A0A9X4M694_9CYAN|nr:hypothetical protein [Pseudanabaena catenata]MDG3494528.1 hypothetical protein [Pseudanabaena catenata USMAC16]